MPLFISKARDFQVTLETEGLPLLDATNHVAGRSRGKRVEFVRGLYQTDDPVTVEQLRRAASFNTEFFEKGNEPGAVNPPTPELLASVMTALARKQADKIRAIIELEESTHQREDVLVAARRALGELGDPEGTRGPGRPPARQAA